MLLQKLAYLEKQVREEQDDCETDINDCFKAVLEVSQEICINHLMVPCLGLQARADSSKLNTLINVS